MSMSVPDFVEALWISVQPIIAAAAIATHVRRSPLDGRPDSSCHVLLRRGAAEIELLAWESGMADVNSMPVVGPINMEHFDDIRSPEALGGLLSRLAAMALS